MKGGRKQTAASDEGGETHCFDVRVAHVRIFRDTDKLDLRVGNVPIDLVVLDRAEQTEKQLASGGTRFARCLPKHKKAHHMSRCHAGAREQPAEPFAAAPLPFSSTISKDACTMYWNFSVSSSPSSKLRMYSGLFYQNS